MKSEDAKECRLLAQELNGLVNVVAECSNAQQEIPNRCEKEYSYTSEDDSDNEIRQLIYKIRCNWSILLNGDCESDNNLEGAFKDSVCDKFTTNSSTNVCARELKLDELIEEMKSMEIHNDHQLLNGNIENFHEKNYFRQTKEERFFEDNDMNIDFDM